MLAGRQSHDLAGGAGWFLIVVWPFAVGWFVVSLMARLYAGRGDAWTRLAATWIGGTAVALLLRVLAAGRTAPVAFAIVAVTFLGATTFGWRLVVMLVSRWRRRHGSPA